VIWFVPHPFRLWKGRGTSSNGNSNSQERGRDGSTAVLALVACFCQLQKLAVKLLRLSVFFRSVESVHGRPIESPEQVNKLCWGLLWRSEVERILTCGDFLLGHPGLSKALRDVSVHSPSHGADEAFRRRGRERRADFEELRHECRIIGDPVAHHDAATRFCDADHLLGDLERLRREHRTEHGDC